MKYRNIRNGAVIDIPSVLVDNEWEPLAPTPKYKDKENSSTAPEPKKGKTKKAVK